MDEEALFGRIRDLEVTTAVQEERIAAHDKRLEKLEFKVAGWVGLLVLIIQGAFYFLDKH